MKQRTWTDVLGPFTGFEQTGFDPDNRPCILIEENAGYRIIRTWERHEADRCREAYEAWRREAAIMTAPKHTPEPWGWQRMGEWHLVGQHGMRPIVLAPNRKPLRVCEDGILVPLYPTHPDAARIVACVNAMAGKPDPAAYVEAVRETWATMQRLQTLASVAVLPGEELPTVDSLTRDLGSIADALRAALARLDEVGK